MKPRLAMIQEFLKLETSAGLLLVATAVIAVLAANSPLAALYDGLLQLPVSVRLGAFEIAKPLLLWINDGLMAVFFLLIGLEIKRELREGELSSRQQAMLPAIGALGGLVLPAVIYVLLNFSDQAALRGWAIPTATDIAFALGVASLLGPRVPAPLKIFLLALAIIDDLGAIIVIALFYTSELSFISLVLAGFGAAALAGLNLCGVRRLAPYILIGIAVWVCVLKSGIHATLAGVVVGLCVPLERTPGADESPLELLEHSLHPWVTYAIMPAFAFANAGVSLAGISLSSFLTPIPLGITLGLFLGKQVGVFGTSWLAVRLGLSRLPGGVGWRSLYGVALLTGIGFTMSLFIGSLAFEDPAYAAPMRLGVFAGSILSALAGFWLLRSTGPRAA